MLFVFIVDGFCVLRFLIFELKLIRCFVDFLFHDNSESASEY